MDGDKVQRPADAIILLSGGLDSMVTAGLAREAGFNLHLLTIDYGQRHDCEIEAARRIANHLEAASHEVLRLDLRSFGGSALTDDIAVPKSGVDVSIPVTYVPARNLVFLALTIACCEARSARDVFIGVNALDYSGYPDCRPDFIASFEQTAALGTRTGVEGRPIRIHAPLQHLSKAEIARECQRLGLDPGWSWSCYDPAEDGRACGLCDSCRLRQKGFAEAGIADSTQYAQTFKP